MKKTIAALALVVLMVPFLSMGEEEFKLFDGLVTVDDYTRLSGKQQLLYVSGFVDAMAVAPVLVREEAPHKESIREFMTREVEGKVNPVDRESNIMTLISDYIKRHPEHHDLAMNLVILLAVDESYVPR